MGRGNPGVDGEAAVAKTAAGAEIVETGIVGIGVSTRATDADHHVLDLETEIENVKRRIRATEAQQRRCRKVKVTRIGATAWFEVTELFSPRPLPPCASSSKTSSGNF